MCWGSWGGRIPPNAVGGNIPLASGTLIYNQHNTNLTQNTQPHTTTNHNKMARHRATSATASTAAHSPPASPILRLSTSWAMPGTLAFVFFCAVGVAWGAEKATHERGRAQALGGCILCWFYAGFTKFYLFKYCTR